MLRYGRAAPRGRSRAARSPALLDDERLVVDEAVGPVLSALHRRDDRMRALARVLGGVPVGRRVAATDLAAAAADTQVQPVAAYRQAVLAAVGVLGPPDRDLIQVCAVDHWGSSLSALGGLCARVDERGQRRLELLAHLLILGRQAQLLAEVLRVLVDREPRARRRELEQHAARLAEVDAQEVLAVDDRRRPRADPPQVVTPRGVLVVAIAPGDVMH